jgi:hypothetical protein
VFSFVLRTTCKKQWLRGAASRRTFCSGLVRTSEKALKLESLLGTLPFQDDKYIALSQKELSRDSSSAWIETGSLVSVS